MFKIKIIHPFKRFQKKNENVQEKKKQRKHVTSAVPLAGVFPWGGCAHHVVGDVAHSGVRGLTVVVGNSLHVNLSQF
jgi:hypothetical protein